MPRPIWFHERLWVERLIQFPDSQTTWNPIEKLSESPSGETKEEADKWGRPPFRAAEFVCECVEDPATQAYLTVYLQTPYLGTETLPARFRAEQATLQKLPTNPEEAIEAWGRLTAHNVDVTGHLMAHKQEAQGEEDPVPGGWYVHSHFELPSNTYIDVDRLFDPVVLAAFGLVQEPYDISSLGEEPVSDQKLEETCWVL
ncbi:hypothetical protein BJX96DRAFT_171493 [Aspergillus floccosus]